MHPFHCHFNCFWGYFAYFSTLTRFNWVEINYFLLIPGQTFFANFKNAKWKRLKKDQSTVRPI